MSVMIWSILGLGIASPILFYYDTFVNPREESSPSTFDKNETELPYNTEFNSSLSSSIPASPDSSKPFPDKSEKEPAPVYRKHNVKPLSSSTSHNKSKLNGTNIVKETLASPDPDSRNAVAPLKVQPTKVSSTTPLSGKPPQKTIYEISKSNGTFYSAQKIIEGVIIGKRGTAKDHADFYKIRATGITMTLKLESYLKNRDHRFIMTVYDANQRVIGESSEEMSRTINLKVTPQSTYYIKLGLNRAPIETHRYKLLVLFR